MKGLIPATLLHDIEDDLHQPISKLADSISGTSIGGILAILLSAGIPASRGVSFFSEFGPRIFKKAHRLNPMGLFKPQYSDTVIEDILKGILEHKTLSQTAIPVVVPSFDIRGHSPLFFKTSDAKRDRECDYELWEAARATSAAQTYFPAFQMDRMTLIDGGNIANNPAACLYAEMKREYPLDRIRILSIGCGNTQNKSNKREMDRAGKWGAVRNLVTTFDVLFSGGPEVVDYQMSILLGNDYLRLDPVLTSDVTLDGVTPDYLSKLKNEGYHFSTQKLTTAIKFIKGQRL